MKCLRRFFTRLVSFAARRTQEERLREEIEEHIALQAAENLRAGLPPVEARRQAMLKFGGVEAMKQDYRAERGLPLIEDFLQDLRFALRLLRKSPGFTAVATVLGYKGRKHRGMSIDRGQMLCIEGGDPSH